MGIFFAIYVKALVRVGSWLQSVELLARRKH